MNMTETIISEVKPKNRIKYVVILIAGLVILGLAIFNSFNWEVTGKCTGCGVDEYNNYFSFFILEFSGIKEVYAQGFCPSACGTEFARIHYIDLYLISLLMIGYGIRGLIKKN